MTTFDTKELIDNLEQQTKDFLQRAVLQWQMESRLKLQRQPLPNSWSAAQCIEHLNSYGRYYLPAIESTISKAKKLNWTASNCFTPGWLGDYFTELMLPAAEGQKTKKMSAPKNHVPPADLDNDKVISEFINQQEKLLALLNEARGINLAKAKVPISISRFIKLKLGDTFRFLVAHNRRHVLQAERALTNISKTVESALSKV